MTGREQSPETVQRTQPYQQTEADLPIETHPQPKQRNSDEPIHDLKQQALVIIIVTIIVTIIIIMRLFIKISENNKSLSMI